MTESSCRNGSPKTIDLAPGQTWSDCQLYGDGKGHYLGHIHLETSDQTEFDGGGPTDGITSYPANTGGGIMVCFGKTGLTLPWKS